MTPESYIEQAGERMRADGSTVSIVNLPGGPALVGYQTQFRMSWFATRLHLFTVLVGVPQATAPLLASVMTQATEYAKRTKGQLRGLQTGVAAIPALVSPEVRPDARAAAEARPDKAWAAIALPAIVDLTAGQTYTYTGRLLWGAAYAGWLRQRLHTALPPAR